MAALLITRNRYKGTVVSAAPQVPSRPGASRAKGGAVVKKVIIWVLLVFAVYSVVATPNESADAIRTAGTALQSAGASVIDFFQGLNSE